jgi:hypothetical protein
MKALETIVLIRELIAAAEDAIDGVSFNQQSIAAAEGKLRFAKAREEAYQWIEKRKVTK